MTQRRPRQRGSGAARRRPGTLIRIRNRNALRTRLLPLHVAVSLQGFMLWVPVEKLFMNEIGFDAAAVGLMAAAYAAVVPIVEIPSGILADRWSRRGMLIVASIALMLFALIGGLSTDVPAYILSALLLGVYFAMYSGTMESIVYDTVLEETGDSDVFEHRIGRVRLIESVALVVSSLLGGGLAGLTSTRLTYFLTVPFAALSIVAYLRFSEPQLHKAGERTSLRRHLGITYRTLTRRGRLLPIITLAVLTSLVLQMLFEFGPLWLVALAVPAVLYGPYWAALVSTLGLGGLLAGRLQLDKPAAVGAVVGLMTLASLALTTTTGAVIVTIAQVVLAVLVVLASIHVTRLLHDSVPSTIRSGVASGVSAVSWMVFLPVALAFGVVSTHHGVHTAGWMLTAATVLAGLLLARTTLGHRTDTAADDPDTSAQADVAVQAAAA
jgi:MFS family permease